MIGQKSDLRVRPSRDGRVTTCRPDQSPEPEKRAATIGPSDSQGERRWILSLATAWA
jgi:hypothetical protein